jgi:hypothetical protein
MRTLAGLSVLLWQLTAAAQTPTPVQTCIQGALRSYEKFRYERALKQMNGCARLRGRTQEEGVSLLLYKGILLAELGKKEEATLAFEEALRQQPGAELPIMVSPKISQVFEAVSANLALEKSSAGRRATEPRPRPGSQPARAAPPQKEPATAAASTPLPAGAAQAPGDSRIIQFPSGPTSVELNVSPVQTVVMNPSLPLELQEALFRKAFLSDPVMEQRSRAFSPQIVIPATLGVLATGTGVSFWLFAKKDYSSLEKDDPRIVDDASAKHLVSRGSTYQNVGLGLLGTGLVGLGLAAGLYGLSTPDTPVDLSVGTKGALTVRGRWW